MDRAAPENARYILADTPNTAQQARTHVFSASSRCRAIARRFDAPRLGPRWQRFWPSRLSEPHERRHRRRKRRQRRQIDHRLRRRVPHRCARRNRQGLHRQNRRRGQNLLRRQLRPRPPDRERRQGRSLLQRRRGMDGLPRPAQPAAAQEPPRRRRQPTGDDRARSTAPRKSTSSPGFSVASALGDNGRLATGDPDFVSGWQYAQAALTKLGAWEAIAPRLVRAENVRAALAYVAARAKLDSGIVYSTDAQAEKRVKVVGTFPENSHPPIRLPRSPRRPPMLADGAKYVEFVKRGEPEDFPEVRLQSSAVAKPEAGQFSQVTLQRAHATGTLRHFSGPTDSPFCFKGTLRCLDEHDRRRRYPGADSEIRFGQVSLPQVRIRTTDPGAILDELTGRVASAPRFFERTAVCLDLSALDKEPDAERGARGPGRHHARRDGHGRPRARHGRRRRAGAGARPAGAHVLPRTRHEDAAGAAAGGPCATGVRQARAA